MELQKFAVDNAQRLVLLRDRISKVRPAQQIFEQMMGARPAVAIEVEVYELRRNRSLNAGTGLPSSTEIFAVAESPSTGVDRRLPAIPLSSARTVQPRLAITLGDAALVANLLKTAGSQRQRSEVRTLHGMPAQFAIGERYPILTAGFFGGDVGGNAFRPPPTFQFENLGLTLKATPHTHGLGETTVELEAEFKLLAGGQINGIPVLTNRKFVSTVRLRNGEWALISGVGTAARTLTKAGPAGLIRIPLLGRLFSRNTVEFDESETVVLLRPRLLGLPPSEEWTREIRLGSETYPRIPL
jgi:general secretion pathway protein D